jgi:hypothetical protein
MARGSIPFNQHQEVPSYYDVHNKGQAKSDELCLFVDDLWCVAGQS